VRAWTLRQLALELHVTPDSLRQRVARGTLAAEKVGTVWVVSDHEAKRAIDHHVAEVSRRAREIVLRPHRKQPSGVDQHGGRS